MLALLGVSARPSDDDEIARRLDVHPRQTINQVCRRLEREGVLRRWLGLDGKLVNELLARSAPHVDPALADDGAETGASAGRDRLPRTGLEAGVGTPGKEVS
ncbi:MAG: hypothetical protein M3P96_13505 [Actinomycetota bacterium]|nr:hypothetical protein [Actinomycetota bacterium]